MKPKTVKILYWTVLIFLTMGILPSAIPSALGLPYAIEHFNGHLGYPVYFLYFTGLTKILGIIALYIPGYPRLKEWVFAGFVFDLVGAIYSTISVGDGVQHYLPIFAVLIVLVILYVLYHKRLSLSQVAPLRQA